MAESLEESLIRALDTFIEAKGHIKASLILVLLAFLLHVIGYSTPGWLNMESARIGIWRHCDSSTAYECCQWADDIMTEKAWLQGARVFLSLGMISGLVALVSIILKSFAKNLASKKPLKFVFVVSSCIAALSIIIGVSIFGGRYRFEPQLKEYYPSGSLAICVIAGVLFLLCSALLLFGAENTVDVAPVTSSTDTSQPRAEPTAPPMEENPSHFSTINGGQNPSAGQNQNQTQDDANTCVICLDRQISTLFLPCRHSKCCRECSNSLPNPRICPICRGTVDQIIDIYR